MYRRSSSVEFQQIDDEGVLLDMNSGRYFRLNSSAADIWRLLESPADLDELAGRLAEIYATPSAEISADVKQLLGEMLELGVIEGSS